ncbi:MAG: patatin-like phospholipase family protein [Candidatus Paracaedibacteraceae bacterium]|nr:patatin-like phospholipase family protein [Candidatus Paracaedibacteraceae bacterium]
MTSHSSFHHKFTAWLTLTTFLISCLSPLQVLAMQHDGEENHHNANSAQQSSSHVTNVSTIEELLAADERDLKQKIEAICNKGQQNTTAPQVTLTGPDLGPYMIFQETALDLLSLNADGQQVKENKEGMHPVKGRGGVHFKSNHSSEPLTPAMEKAIYLLQMLLVGEGITPSTLLVLKNVMLPRKDSASQELGQKLTPTTHIIQASRTVEGISLQQFFEDVEQKKRKWEDLDPQNFTAQILSSLLIHPFDARPDNFMVVFDKSGKGHIVGIDNDKALSEPILRKTKLKGHPRVAHYLGNKNILYCLQELMGKKINDVVVDRILSHNPHALILKWLQKLDYADNQYQDLQKLNLLNGDEAKKRELPLHLAPGKVLQLVNQLERMQAYLRSASQGVSHNQLFEFLYPLVYEHYQALIRDASNSINNKKDLPPYPLNVISRIFPGQGEERSLQQMLPLRARLKDENGTPIHKALRAETGFRLAHKECTQSIAQAAEELIKHCDLSFYESNATAQAELLLIAGQAFPQSLINAHFSWRDSRLVQKVFRKELPAEVLKFFPHLGIDLSSLSRESLLHQALGHPAEMVCELIDQLVDQGISLEERDHKYRTVLEVAMKRRLYPIVNHLVDKGAREVWFKVALDYYKSLGPSDQRSRLYFKYLEAVNPELLWHRTLDTLLPKEGEGKVLQGAKGGRRVLSKAFESQLFDAKNENKLIKANEYGRRDVGRIQKDGYSLYFKPYPEFPGTEQGVSSLVHSLVGQGAPYGELFRLEGRPYYVSQGVQGHPLQDILYDKEHKCPHTQEHVEAYLSKLSPKSISEMIVMAMLLNPEDGKPDNYIVEPLPDGSYRLVGVDNDHNLGPAFAREEKGIIPQVKCVLYCLDQMQHSLHPEVWEKFRTIDSPQALKKWLIGLSVVNKEYESLFNSDEAKKLLFQKDKESFIGVAFTPLMLSRLYEKFVRLQHALSKQDKNKPFSHLELLKHVEPKLYERYRRGFERNWSYQKGNRVWQRFMTIDGPYFGQGKDGVPLSSHCFAGFLTSLNIPIKKELIEEVRKGHHIGPDLAMLELESIIKEINELIVDKGLQKFKELKTDKQREKFMRRLDFKENKISLPEQRAWVAALGQLEHLRVLTLQNCEALADENFLGLPPLSIFEKMMGRTGPRVPLIEVMNLRKLNVSGCEALTPKSINYILKAAPTLETLNISLLKKLPTLNLASRSLKWLSMEGCSGLETFQIEAPHLRTLVANSCTSLTSLTIITPNLKELDLRESSSLSDEMVDAQVQNCSHLKTLKLEGCNQISFREIREKHPLYPLGLFKNFSPWIQIEIIKSLDTNNKITTLSLKDEKIRSKEVKALAAFFKSNTTLTSLSLKDNYIDAEGMKALAPLVENNTTLTSLTLTGNWIFDKGMKALASALQHNTTLTSLNLRGNWFVAKNLRGNIIVIGAEGMKVLAPVLQHNTTLTSLNLSDNKINAEGMKAFVPVVENNTTLTSLNLAGNKIGDDQLKVIEEWLERNRAQRYSSSSQDGNKIPSKTFKALFKDSSLTLTRSDTPEADNTHLQLLKGVDKAKVLHHLVRDREDITLLLMPLVGQAFKKGQFSDILFQDGHELLQKWQKSRANVQRRLDVLKEYIPSYPEHPEAAASFLKNYPELIEALNPEEQGACKEFAKAYLALQQVDEQVHLYCAEESIFTAFIERYFSQPQYLYQEQGLKALAHVFRIQFHLWQQEGQDLTHQASFGEDIYEKKVHLLKQDSSLILLKSSSEQDSMKQQKTSDKGKKRIKDDEQEEEAEEERSHTVTEEEFSSVNIPSPGNTSFHSSSSQTSSSQEEIFLDTQRSDRDSDTFYVGLSLDGAGIATYMAAYNLQKLEEYANKPLHELIDYIGGTSMGGILALGLMATEDSYTPLWKPSDMLGLLRKEGPYIFPEHAGIIRGWDPAFKLKSTCYPAHHFERVLKKTFGSLRLSDVLKPTLVKALKIRQNDDLVLYDIHDFESTLAQSNEYDDYLIRDVARAVSAAPGAFPRVSIKNVHEGNEQMFLDASIECNNPARAVHDNISNLYNDVPYPASKKNTFIISMGMGIGKKCSASAPEIAKLMASSSHKAHKGMEKFLQQHSTIEGKIYCRLQPDLEQAINITDASSETFEILEDAAKTLNGKIKRLAEILAENKDRKHPASLWGSE